MHLGKFHFALATLHEEIKKQASTTKIESLIQSLNQIGANPGNPSMATAFKDSLEQLRQSLLTSSLNNPHPTLAMHLDSIAARTFIGEKLFETIKEVISANQLAPQQAASSLQELLAVTKKFYDTVVKADDAFTELNVECTDIDPGENEIGISIPVVEGTKTLKDLSKEANSWHNALAPFVEMYSLDHDPIKLRVMSSSDWQFYLYSTPPVLLGISLCIKSVNQILRDLINSRQLIKQLAGSGTSPAVIEAAQADTDGRLEQQIRKLAEETVDQNYGAKDDGRKNELKNAFSQSMNFIAHQIARGVTLEVRLIPPKPVKRVGPEEQESAETLERITKTEELTAIAVSIENNMEFPALDITLAETLVLPGREEENV